jgi:DNA-binding NarL/FixJ family response regulator
LSSPLRVLLADDHALVRAGLRKLLESLPGVEVVAEAGDGREAVALVVSKDPDLALLDIAMPGLNGLEAAARIVAEHPRTRVLLLSMHGSEEHVLQALRAGASGYLLKDAALTELELAIEAVRNGETYLSPAISRHVGEYVRRTGAEATERESLTLRQREILQLIAEGNSTKQIAALLGVSVKTVETHRAQLMEKLDIHEVAGLVRYAIRIGLVSPER